MNIIIQNDRDQRGLDWLIKQVGQPAVEAVALAGQRKLFVSNVSKALGLRIPESVTVTPKQKGLEKLQALRDAGLLRKS